MKKRILSGLLAAVMAFSVVGVVPAEAAKAERNYQKVSLKMISGEGTKEKPNVEIAAWDNYDVTVDLNNDKVNRSAVTLDLTMKDVANLDVNGEKHADFTFKTGLEKTDPDKLSTYIGFDNFTEAVVNADVNGKAFKYNVAGEFDGTNNTGKWTAIPESEEAVRAAWKELTGYVSTKTYDKDDSMIIIPNGAYLHVGNEKLYFESKEDLVIDNINDNTDALIESIKKAVKLDTNVAEPEDCQMVAYIPAGATLRVGQSEATLTEAATIKVDGMNEEWKYRSSLDEFRKAANASTGRMTELVKTALYLVGDVLGGAQGQELTVSITTADYETEKTIADAQAKAEAAEKAQKEAEAKLEAAKKQLESAKAQAEAEATAKGEALAKVEEAKKALEEAKVALAVTKATVKNLTATVANSTLTATWAKVEGAAKYNVAVTRNGKDWKTETTTNTTYSVPVSTGLVYGVKVTPVATVDNEEFAGIEAAKSVTVKLATPVVTAKKSGSKAKVSLKKRIANATGYEVRIASKKNMKGAKTYKIAKAVKFTKKYSLKGKKTYIQVRAYRTYNNVKVYSNWSAKKTVKK